MREKERFSPKTVSEITGKSVQGYPRPHYYGIDEETIIEQRKVHLQIPPHPLSRKGLVAEEG